MLTMACHPPLPAMHSFPCVPWMPAARRDACMGARSSRGSTRQTTTLLPFTARPPYTCKRPVGPPCRGSKAGRARPRTQCRPSHRVQRIARGSRTSTQRPPRARATCAATRTARARICPSRPYSNPSPRGKCAPGGRYQARTPAQRSHTPCAWRQPLHRRPVLAMLPCGAGLRSSQHVQCTRGCATRAGDSIGSSLKLLDELIDLAPCLGVRLEGNESLPKSEAARLAAAGRDQSVPLHRELQAWLTLHEAAELSLSYGTAIHFSSSGG